MIDSTFSIFKAENMTFSLIPLQFVCREVKNRNSLLLEDNLLSLSYGKIIRKDIGTNEGLLPESFDGYNIVEPGDIVLRLTDLQNDKKSLRTGLVRERGIITSAYTTIRAIGVDSRWLAYSLHSYDIQKVFYSLGSGLRQSMKFDDLKSLAISVPPIDVQRRLADYLDEQVLIADQLIDKRSKHIALTWEFTAAKLSETFLKDSGKKIRLKRLIAEEKLGIWGDEMGVNSFDVYVARVADFNRNIFKLRNVETQRSIEPSQFITRQVLPGDILLERSGGGEKTPVGCSVFVNLELNNLVCSNFVSRIRAVENVDSEYLSMLFATLYSSGLQRPHSSQTTGIQNLDTESYFQIEVPLVDFAEQKILAKVGRDLLNKSGSVVEGLENSVLAVEAYKRSLVTSVITGTYDVNLERSIA